MDTFDGTALRRNTRMSDDHAKTDLDHVHDTLTQLKEMRHYSKHNVEALTRRGCCSTVSCRSWARQPGSTT